MLTLKAAVTAQELEAQAEREHWGDETILTLRFLRTRGSNADEKGRLYPTHIIYQYVHPTKLTGFVHPNLSEGFVEIPLEKLEAVSVLTPLEAVMMLDSLRRRITGSY